MPLDQLSSTLTYTAPVQTRGQVGSSAEGQTSAGRDLAASEIDWRHESEGCRRNMARLAARIAARQAQS